MTGIIQGPEIIFEYLEKNGINEQPEIAISNIGVAFRYDYGKIRNKDNNDEIQTVPPVSVGPVSDYFDKKLEGCTALCKVADTIGFSDPVGKIVTSSCLFLYFRSENGWFDYKPASLIKGKDNCTPYIITAGHVTWPTDNYEEYCVVRFNWYRKRPPNANSNVSLNNYGNCLWDTTTNWNTTIDLTKVIDYCGATLKRGFPCNDTWGTGYDLSILQINSKLIHRAWMAGWDARNNLGMTVVDTSKRAVILSRFGGIPVMYSQGILSIPENKYFGYQADGNYPLKTKVGYSGSPAYFPYYNGSTLQEYLYIGPLVSMGNSGPLLYKSYYDPNYCPGTLQDLHKPTNSLLHDPDNTNTDFQFGVWYNPDSCSTNTTECCDFYFATNNDTASTPNANDSCCNEFEIQERIIDSFVAGDSCGIYTVKIYLEGDELNPITFKKFNGTIWETVNSDNIIANIFKGNQGIRRYKICSPMPDGSQALIQNYWIKFYHGDNVIDSCQKEFLFKCKPECYCDQDRYNIILEKTGETEDGKCCYKAKICFIADSLYKYKYDTCRTEYQNRGNVPSCQSAFISVSAGRDVCDITKPRDCLQFNGIRHVTNYWTRDEALIRNPNCSDTAIIENICIEDPHESYLIFSFLQEPYVGTDLSIIPGLDCKQKVPIGPCNCCDAIDFVPVFDTTCGSQLTYTIKQNNPYGCNINMNSVRIDTIITDANGNETVLGSFDYSIISSTITFPRFSFDTYYSVNNAIRSMNNKVKYRIHFKNADNSENCTKDIEIMPCMFDCLNNLRLEYESNFNDCVTTLWLKLKSGSGTVSIQYYDTVSNTWANSLNPTNIDTYGISINLSPGIYRIKLGSCFYYFVIGCSKCKPAESQLSIDLWIDIEKKANECCYIIKSNKSASTAEVYEIGDTTNAKCTLTKFNISNTYYYDCSYLCNNSDNEKKIWVKFQGGFFSGSCWRVLTLPPCTEMNKCCDSADVEIIRHPGNNNEKTCCYKFNINNVGCNVAEVKIYDGIVNEDNLMATVPTSIINVSQLSEIMDWVCFNKGQFSNKTIKIVMSDGGQQPSLCTLTIDLPPCWEIPPPCEPTPIDTTKWQPSEEGTIKFDCIDGTDTINCNVTFTYTYRHSSIDNSNDIQILAYNANASCNCEETIIDSILKYIWSMESVKSAFGVLDNDPNWPNDSIKCFYNFRVISRDCWQTTTNYYMLSPLEESKSYILHKPCPTDQCCYAWYRVCYFKDRDGIITFSSYERISDILGMLVPICPPYQNKLCVPGNCLTSLPHGTIHIPPITNLEDKLPIPCNVYVVSENTSYETMIRFDCMMNGNVSMQVFDLLGRQVIQENSEKKEYSSRISLSQKLQPGIYFIKLSLNNSMAYYNKFIVSD